MLLFEVIGQRLDVTKCMETVRDIVGDCEFKLVMTLKFNKINKPLEVRSEIILNNIQCLNELENLIKYGYDILETKLENLKNLTCSQTRHQFELQIFC